MKDLVAEAVQGRTRKLLQKAKKTTGRVIAEADVADVFGIDMEEPAAPYKKEKKAPGKTVGGKESLKRQSEKIVTSPLVKGHLDGTGDVGHGDRVFPTCRGPTKATTGNVRARCLSSVEISLSIHIIGNFKARF